MKTFLVLISIFMSCYLYSEIQEKNNLFEKNGNVYLITHFSWNTGSSSGLNYYVFNSPALSLTLDYEMNKKTFVPNFLLNLQIGFPADIKVYSMKNEYNDYIFNENKKKFFIRYNDWNTLWPPLLLMMNFIPNYKIFDKKGFVLKLGLGHGLYFLSYYNTDYIKQENKIILSYVNFFCLAFYAEIRYFVQKNIFVNHALFANYSLLQIIPYDVNVNILRLSGESFVFNLGIGIGVLLF